MTPQQRLQLFAARTAETAAELAAWLAENKRRIARPARGLEIDVAEAARELALLNAAAELPPAVGIVGTGAKGRQALVLELLRPASAQDVDGVTVGFAGLPQGFSLARHILPAGEARTTALTYRIGREDRSPPGHPVRIALLSELDVIRILAGVHLSQSAHTSDPVQIAARLDTLFSEAETRILPAATPGLTPNETADLEAYLAHAFPGSTLARTLTAAGYWERLGAIASYLPPSERQRLLAVLWGEDPGLTLLFASLSNGLDKLAHAADVHAVLDALMRRDASSGWFKPHPESLLATTTLKRLGTGGATDDTVSVTRRGGAALEIDRPVLAALAADISLRIAHPAALEASGSGTT
ncbi:MAG: hypothetical protein RL291_985, partial [Pseudomonadota bacterium]